MKYIFGVTYILLTVSSVFAPAPDLTVIEHDFSPETYTHINSSKAQKEYKKFDLKDMERDTRRWALFWYSWFAHKQTYHWRYNYLSCVSMCTTYLAAYPKIRLYYEMRYFYVNTKEYEIGYLVYEIIRKYQMMIEIYQVMYYKFFLNQVGWTAPVTYVFYMYRLEVELTMHITHLTRMLHEAENKYKEAPLNHWDDYPETEEQVEKRTRARQVKVVNAEAEYEKRRLQEYKKRQRERRKKRKQIDVRTLVTKAPKKQIKSFWPLNYGWSIEFW